MYKCELWIRINTVVQNFSEQYIQMTGVIITLYSLYVIIFITLFNIGR